MQNGGKSEAPDTFVSNEGHRQVDFLLPPLQGPSSYLGFGGFVLHVVDFSVKTFPTKHDTGMSPGL